jgi:hypothetical protein
MQLKQTHTNPEVLKMWSKYANACDYILIAKVEDASNVFSDFTPFV